jgi:hypothetical protein
VGGLFVGTTCYSQLVMPSFVRVLRAGNLIAVDNGRDSPGGDQMRELHSNRMSLRSPDKRDQ